MSQIENNFIYDDKGVVANLVKPFERKDRFPSDKTTVFGSYSAALDYANNNPSAYVGQIISVVDEDGGVKVYKLTSSSNEAEYATLKEIGEGGNTSTPPIGDLEGYATIQWVNEQGYITLDDIPEVAVPSKTSDLTNDSGFITINDIPEVAVPTKVSDLENDKGYITDEALSDKVSFGKVLYYTTELPVMSFIDNKIIGTYTDIEGLTYNDEYKYGEIIILSKDSSEISKDCSKYILVEDFDGDPLWVELGSHVELEFDSANQALVLRDKNGNPISIVNISNVISSGFLKNAEYDDTNKTLVFTFITEDGTDRVVTVDLGDIIKTYTSGEGIDITNNGEISISASKLEEIQSMGADIVRVEGLVNAAQSAANTAQGKVDALETRVGAIEGDYLNSTDKTELEDKITAAESAADKAQGEVDALEIVVATKAAQSDLIAHTGDGGIHVTPQQKIDWQNATDAINAFLDENAVADNVINTLVEIREYLNSEDGSVETLLDDVASIKTSLAAGGDTAKAIAAAQSAADKAQDEVDAIAADYLKGADKTELEGKITAAQNAADAAVKGVDDFNSELNKKEDKLIDGKTIKTINGIPILGEGNIEVTSNGIIDMSKYVSLEKFKELESKYTDLNNIVETLKQEVESLKNGNINIGNAITELKSGSDDIKIERNGSVVTITLDDITNVTFGDGEDIESCDEDCFDDCDDCGDSPWPPCSEDNEVCDEDNESY